eukprot:9502824-Pyramimonas_sp.AAC.1
MACARGAVVGHSEQRRCSHSFGSRVSRYSLSSITFRASPSPLHVRTSSLRSRQRMRWRSTVAAITRAAARAIMR